MSDNRHTSSSLRSACAAATAGAALALVVAVCAGPAGAQTELSRTSASLVQPVVTPGDVPAIVATDTAINNRANGSLSIALQDSHEACLQQVLDDATYRGDLAAGSNTLGGSFDQVPGRTFVPRETAYPAFFSVLAADRASGQPTTSNLLTYVKTSSGGRWKLASSSEILGPTAAGVAVPAAATDAQGYVTKLDRATTDGLVTAPGKVAARVATAFTSEARSGRLPAGITAQFGPKKLADPHTIAASYANLGSATVQYSDAVPAAAAAGAPSPNCPYPAIRLAGGGALVTFAIFQKVVVHVRTGYAVVQPSDRSVLGVLVAPGTYTSITMVSGDMAVAVVPPAGSHSPIEVIGQASEGLTGTGVTGTGSSGSGGAGGPANASAIARRVNPGLVDINITLSYLGGKAAGTAMVLTPNGEVLTNNHVIEGATSISVTDVGNGKTYGARVVGYDRTGDIAVLQLEKASGLKTVNLGNSATIHVGQPVVGIGNAGGTGGTPSYAGGSVVALNRSINASDQGTGTSEQLTGLIETNANIQPGDSGGPLVNTSAKVVGMDTAASAGYSFGQGGALTQGYSIPINTALKIADQITGGRASATVHIGPTAFLGVKVAFSSPGGPSGAVIQSVVPGSPASRAGLAQGDTITSLAGHAVGSPNALTTIIESEKPGASVGLGYVSPSGSKRSATVRLSAGPPQ